jgi:hypothetical protein
MSHNIKIGGDRGAKGRAAASQNSRKQADARAADLAPVIARLRRCTLTPRKMRSSILGDGLAS